MLSGGAFTEPGHGSDITSLDTTAVRHGDEWVINGTKTFITNGGLAGFYCTLCQTDVGEPAVLPRDQHDPGGGRPAGAAPPPTSARRWAST
ncbi:MAG: acyl-CoA dehydrogenase family protein [Desulfobacterales bacterium]|nr:acyl-CoA dehydrogenase family protein [Desulfobacterales bacterium]